VHRRYLGIASMTVAAYHVGLPNSTCMLLSQHHVQLMYCNVYCFLTDNVRLARRKLRHAAICILISAVTGSDGSDVMRSWCLGRRISYQPAPDAAAGRVKWY